MDSYICIKNIGTLRLYVDIRFSRDTFHYAYCQHFSLGYFRLPHSFVAQQFGAPHDVIHVNASCILFTSAGGLLPALLLPPLTISCILITSDPAMVGGGLPTSAKSELGTVAS